MFSPKYKLLWAIPAQHSDSMMTLLREEYLPDETMHRSFVIYNNGLYENDLQEQLFQETKNYFYGNLLSHSPAVLACEISTNKIVGFLVLQSRGFPNNSPENNLTDAPLDKLNSHHYNTIESANLPNTYPWTKKPLLLTYLVVHKAHRRNRVAMLMLRTAMKHAKSHGYDLVYGIFTSAGSKKAAEKMRMASFFDLDLRAVVDHHGQRAFADMGEDSVVSVMGIKII